MDHSHPHNFSSLSGELCNLLYLKNCDKSRVNNIIDDLNSRPYNVEFFVHKNDGSTLLTALCLNIEPTEDFLAAKASHLMVNIGNKQNLQLSADFLKNVIAWHVKCIQQCSNVIVPDLMHNLQHLLHHNPQAAVQFTEVLIGEQGLLLKFIDSETSINSSNKISLSFISLKCICSLITTCEDNPTALSSCLNLESKQALSQKIINYLIKCNIQSQDEFVHCKVIIYTLRILSQLYLGKTENIPLPDVMGICRYFVLYGLVPQGPRPEKIMPSQQTIAVPIISNPKGGKKQKLRKQRNNAIESLKKDIPVSDRSLMKDVTSYENSSAYKPAHTNYLEPHRAKNATTWPLTSDSDISDVESGREAKLIALKSRVRQGASNLLLVLVKMTEKRDMFGYWWALLPDCPNTKVWAMENSSKRTLSYCAVSDPIASSRTSVLSVILALLSGSRTYLSQAESSKKETTSFTPFSVSLGFTISCLHKVLTGILDTERSIAVILVTLKCCAALVQATPYHKMRAGLISEMVRSTRRFLIHRDVTLQVGALITIGCVLSVDPKVEELLKSVEKDSVNLKKSTTLANSDKCVNECDDFEEGYSDDEMFIESRNEEVSGADHETICFKSWILDICFRNMGWTFKGLEIVKCKSSAIPIVLESLQVVSAVAFHYFQPLLSPHLTLLADILSEALQFDHQDVIAQAARTVSVVGDAIQKLDVLEQSPPLHQCVQFWEKILPPLTTVLQRDNPLAKAVACDCLANIGEKSFKELPRRVQVLCCTLLVGSCSDEDMTVRAAAVRALAMTVMYRSLREDIFFVSDCGENILRALQEPSLVVRVKAAWALGNLSDALVLNMEEADIEDEIDDDLLFRLLEVSIKCATDNDKIKMSATRGLGNLLRLIKEENLNRNPQIKPLCEGAIDKLVECACKVSNMKVRWNACYAMGNAMKNNSLFICFNRWQSNVFSNLCALTQESKNLKVRINAAVALRAPQSRDQYAEHLAPIWRAVMAAMENAAYVDDYTEYKHKDKLIEQLCVTLAHLCCVLTSSDLSDIVDALSFHLECARSLFTQLSHKLPPEDVSCVKILEAATYVTANLTAISELQQNSLRMLQDIFIWDL